MQNICTNKAKISEQHWWNYNNNPNLIPSSKCIHLIQIKLKCREPAVKPGYVLPPKQPNIHKRFSKCKNRNISQMCHNNHHMLPSTTEFPPKAKIKEKTQATKIRVYWKNVDQTLLQPKCPVKLCERKPNT